MPDVEERLSKLEHIMYGNGEKGALEILRSTSEDVKIMKPKVEGLEKFMIKSGAVCVCLLAIINIILKVI